MGFFEVWAKSASNPIVIPSAVWEGGAPPAGNIEEGRLYKVGTTWYMFYTAGNGMTGLSIGYATTSEGSYPSGWSKFASNPVLAHNTQSGVDELAIAAPVVVPMQDGSYRMYYTAAPSGQPAGTTYIAMATATSGGFPNTWTKYASNPIMLPGVGNVFDNLSVRPACIIPPWQAPDLTTWHMYYGGLYSAGFETTQIGHATSTDGIAWTRDPANPIIPKVANTWEAKNYPLAWFFANGLYYLVYIGGPDDTLWRSGFATSPDLVTWTKSSKNPILYEGGVTQWDSKGVGITSVVYDPANSILDAWYIGSNIDVDNGFAIGLARASVIGPSRVRF